MNKHIEHSFVRARCKVYWMSLLELTVRVFTSFQHVKLTLLCCCWWWQAAVVKQWQLFERRWTIAFASR